MNCCRLLAGVGLLLLAGLTTGCTPGQHDGSAAAARAAIPQMWSDQIDQALKDPSLSEFEQEVLSDYRISDAEYQEAQTRYVQCMAEQGWTVTFDAGQYTIKGAPGTGHEHQTVSDATDQQCMKDSLNYIEPIYLGMRDNPQGLTESQQVQACYEKNGVPDGKGLSDDEFAKMLADPEYRASTGPGKICRYDPAGTAGVTEQMAEELEKQGPPSASVLSSPQPAHS